MAGLSTVSSVSLYVLVALLALSLLLLWPLQVTVLRGRPFKNPDGSTDDWHEQKTHYGIALADIFVTCPAGIAGVILVLLQSRWGFYLLALVSFFFVWANVMTTATSLRFHKPRLTLTWFIAFPFGALLGLAFLIWVMAHFDWIYKL